MKKIDYILISYKQAIKKIWNLIYNRFVKLKKSRLYLPLAYLFLIFGCLGLLLILLIGLIAYLVILFQDIHFTPHYMQTVIAHNNLSAEQANEYLISQQQEYKKSLSYGNFSTQQRDSIDTTFELLFNEYKLPEPEDKKHQEIITSLSDVKNISLESNKEILELNSNVDSLSSSVASQSNSIAEAKQSIEENGATIQASISDLSTLVTENKENITSQIQNQNNLFREELSKTNDKILESADVLSEQNNIIKTDITIISQSVDNIHSTIANSTNGINELSQQLTENNSNTQKLLSNIDSNIEGLKSTIEPVTLYTEQKQQQEKELEEDRKARKLYQEERTKRNKKRVNSKNPEHFECSLTDQQLELLLECCEDIKVFKNLVTKQELHDIFLCLHKSPLQTTNARLLSLLFSNLQNAGYIHSEWQSIAARHVCFKSKLGNEMKTNNDFSTAAAASSSVNPEKEIIIHKYIKKMKHLQ